MNSKIDMNNKKNAIGVKKTLQIKVHLRELRPSIYRTFILSEDTTFQELHDYIQKTFWFSDINLWHFYKKNSQLWKFLKIIKKDNDFFEDIFKNTFKPEEVKLKDIFIKMWLPGIVYEYDFWNSWKFDVVCQKILEDDWVQKIKLKKLNDECW